MFFVCKMKNLTFFYVKLMSCSLDLLDFTIAKKKKTLFTWTIH